MASIGRIINGILDIFVKILQGHDDSKLSEFWVNFDVCQFLYSDMGYFFKTLF